MREWLKDIRSKKGLTQEELAKKIEISRPYYTEIEKGLKNPSVKIAKRIASILGFEWTLFFEIE